MPRHILIIGHPLCAEQNRLPFLSQNGIRYTLISPSNWKSRSLNRFYKVRPFQSDNFSLVALPCLFPGYNSFFMWKKLKSKLADLPFDLIYCWEEPWCLSALQIFIYSRNRQIPLIFYSAENKNKKLPLLFRLVQNYVYKISSAAIVTTSEAKTRLQHAKYSKNIFIVPLWVYHTNYISRISVKNTGIYIGRLIPLKGIDLLISALPFLADFKLLIIGNGPEKTCLENLSVKLGVQSRVTFCGVKPETQIEWHKSQASLAVFPTRENENQAEQFGKAAVECLASGLPVLCSNTGNFKWLALSNPICYSKKLRTPLEISNEIKAILGNFPSDKIRKGGSEHILKNYSPSAVSKEFLSCWNHVIQ